jgi:hypothetical protein
MSVFLINFKTFDPSTIVYRIESHELQCILNRGVYSSIIPPPPPPLGGGKESKGLRAREENQRRVEKMERQREKKRKLFRG